MSDETTPADEATRAAGAAQAAERAEQAKGEARATEIRENVAMTDARRAEEEVARAHAEVEKTSEQEQQLSRKERRLREKAERVHAEAERERAQAGEAAAASDAAQERAPHTVSGADVASPGVGTRTEPDAAAAAAKDSTAAFPGADRLPTAAQRPEVLVGAAFGGAFILARILKRIFD
jgi:hypothetical protein